jgi:hypothetical protein
MITIIISVTGRTITSIKYDSKKQIKFLIYMYIIMLIQTNYSFIYVVIQEPKGQL